MTEDFVHTFETAISAARQAYYGDIRKHAAGLAEEIRRGELGTGNEARENLITRIHEDCDSDSWVIYTARAQMVCLASDNSHAYAEEYGSEGLVKGGDINWSAMAYAAMERDLMDQLEAEGVDINDPNPEPEDGGEDEEV